MSYNFQKSDDTLKMQLIRMQLETICYSQIKLKKSTPSKIQAYSEFWLQICKENNIVPENDFREEYVIFEKESLLKFAPEATYSNMEQKAMITLQKMNIDLSKLNL
jgi:hypothetical protein